MIHLNNGGYVLAEANDPNVVLSFVSKLSDIKDGNDVDIIPSEVLGAKTVAQGRPRSLGVVSARAAVGAVSKIVLT